MCELAVGVALTSNFHSYLSKKIKENMVSFFYEHSMHVNTIVNSLQKGQEKGIETSKSRKKLKDWLGKKVR